MMNNEQAICSICGSNLIDKMIDYSDWNNGRLIIVRGVPVRECEANGHRFFRAKVARSLEQLFKAEQQKELAPVEIMEVPVFRLEVG
jgi:YgiT-type zinc finger domain-containing protein